MEQFHNAPTNKRYEELDSLRGIAALLVVFFHFTLGRSEYNTFFKLGTTGVDLFFIISGFVIFMSLQKTSKGLDFVINRVSRLYPTYWAAVSFTFLILLLAAIYKGQPNLSELGLKFIGNLTMFQFYLGIPNLDGPYWTLKIEMLFYISILILFSLKWLRFLNGIGVFLCLTTVLVTQYFYDQKIVGVVLWFIPLFQFIPLFFAGTIFYKISTDKNQLIYKYFLVILCLLCQILLFPYVGESKRYISWTEYNVMLVVYFVLFALFVNNGLKFIVNKTTLFFGKISYALYLLHQCISLNFIIPFFYDKLGINFWVVTIFIDLPLIVGLASFITYKIEVPYSRKMKEKLRTAMAFRSAV